MLDLAKLFNNQQKQWKEKFEKEKTEKKNEESKKMETKAQVYVDKFNTRIKNDIVVGKIRHSYYMGGLDYTFYDLCRYKEFKSKCDEYLNLINSKLQDNFKGYELTVEEHPKINEHDLCHVRLSIINDLN